MTLPFSLVCAPEARAASRPRAPFFPLALTLAAILLGGCNSKSAPPKPPPVPVVGGTVAEKNMPVQLDAIGNVEAYATVAVKARIDGQLVGVRFREGQDVAPGQLLFQIDPRPFEAQLAQAQATLARDEATLTHARSQEQRYQELLQKKFISQEMYAQIRTNRDTAEATVRADQALLDNAKLQLEYASIRSPISGRTGKVMIQAGNLVKANDTTPLVVINQVNPVYVSFAVPEQRLGEVRAAYARHPIVVTAAAPDASGPGAPGRLDFVDNTVDLATGTIRMRAVFPNREHSLWPGQFVHVQATLRIQTDAIVVPAAAVQVGPRGQYVFVIKPDQTVELRDVVVDRTEGDETVIAKGLAAGERIVTDGQSRLTPGAKVSIAQGKA